MLDLTSREIVNIMEGSLLIFGAIFFNRYRTGSVNYNGEREIQRQKKIEKYGPLFFAGSIFCFLSGISIIASTFL